MRLSLSVQVVCADRLNVFVPAGAGNRQTADAKDPEQPSAEKAVWLTRSHSCPEQLICQAASDCRHPLTACCVLRRLEEAAGEGLTLFGNPKEPEQPSAKKKKGHGEASKPSPYEACKCGAPSQCHAMHATAAAWQCSTAAAQLLQSDMRCVCAASGPKTSESQEEEGTCRGQHAQPLRGLQVRSPLFPAASCLPLGA